MYSLLESRGTSVDQEPEPTEKQKAARERLKKDIETLKANAKNAGKKLDEYMRDIGFDNATIDRIMKYVRVASGKEDTK